MERETPLPALVCQVCRVWWPWPVDSPDRCDHTWPDLYATGDAGRRAAMARGYTENCPTQTRLSL